jgi:hypothetical protein
MKRVRGFISIMMDSPDYFCRPLDVRLDHVKAMMESEVLMALKTERGELVKKQLVKPLPAKASSNLWTPVKLTVNDKKEKK